MKITQYMYSRCAQWTYGSSELVPTTAPVNHDRSMIHVRLRLRNCVNAAIINMYKSRIRNENDDRRIYNYYSSLGLGASAFARFWDGSAAKCGHCIVYAYSGV